MICTFIAGVLTDHREEEPRDSHRLRSGGPAESAPVGGRGVRDRRRGRMVRRGEPCNGLTGCSERLKRPGISAISGQKL
jgi:hypothetical protein